MGRIFLPCPSVPTSGPLVSHVPTDLWCFSVALRTTLENVHVLPCSHGHRIDSVLSVGITTHRARRENVPTVLFFLKLRLTSDAEWMHIRRARMDLTLLTTTLHIPNEKGTQQKK